MAAAALIDVVPLIRLPRGVRQRYTYEAESSEKKGDLVWIPWRGRTIMGLVIGPYTGTLTKSVSPRIKKIQGQCLYGPLSVTQWHLFEQLQRDYAATETLAALTVVGTFPKKEPALLRLKKIKSQPLPKLSPTDRSFCRKITTLRGRVVLSGRDYAPSDAVIQALIREVVNKRKQVLCLFADQYSLKKAAEILERHFTTVSYTSEQSLTTRAVLWQQVKASTSQLVLGTRSALFLPYQNLGAIFIFAGGDDGHRSWDQEPHYDVRLLAEAIAEQLSARFYLLSVLPPLLSSSPGTLNTVPSFAARMTVMDQRGVKKIGNAPLASEDVATISGEDRTKRTLIYTNRLGQGLLACADCQTVVRCRRCDKPYTQSSSAARMWICRGCLEEQSFPAACQFCGHTLFRSFGGGTAAIIKQLDGKFDRPLVQIDATMLKAPGQIAHTFDAVAHHGVVVVSTSMIMSRLWALEPFDTIYVLRPEFDFSLAHWRANEETMNTLATLWTHARSEIQLLTSMPDHPLIRLLVEKKTKPYLQQEFEFRKRLRYPPAVTLVVLRLPSGNEATVLLTQLKKEKKLIITQQGQEITLKVPADYDRRRIWGKLPPQTKVDINPI